MRLSSPSTSGRGAVSAANSERSTGHPAAIDPATTYLIKSRRFVLISRSPSHRRFKLGRNLYFSLGARPQSVPGHDCDQRKRKNDAGDCIDLRRDPSTQPSPDFERQSVVPSDQKKTDRN